MIQVDLVTGLLGAGKTTFIKQYARYVMSTGKRVGILENDHGAINVDMLILNELRGDNCEIEMVAGGCDPDCHKRRFKTKLISMAMSGYDRIIIEPSGVFDVDEFFDTLHEEPLDNWYELGNVFCIVDANLPENLSDEEEFLLASQSACAGKLIFSHVIESEDNAEVGQVNQRYESVCDHINISLLKILCKREFTLEDCMIKDLNMLSSEDFESLLHASYHIHDYVKKYDLSTIGFDTLYYLEEHLSGEQLTDIARTFLTDETFGHVVRVKGYVSGDVSGSWIEVNAIQNQVSIRECNVGQEVLIIIGQSLDEEKIGAYVRGEGLRK